MFARFWNMYSRNLNNRPKLTNAVMTGALFGLGDISAQLLFENSEYPKNTKTVKEFEELGLRGQDNTIDHYNYDWYRTLRSITYGSLIFSFIGTKWYNILNYKIRFPKKSISSWNNRFLRVAVDQIIFAPISLPFYFTCMTLLEGNPLHIAKLKIEEQWWDTLRTNWLIWPIVQTFNFSFVPLPYQLLTVNIVAIFWNTFLSYKNSNIVLEKDKYSVLYPPVTE